MESGVGSADQASGLVRFWFTFPEFDEHGCRFASWCGVTGWDEADALALVAELYCSEGVAPVPIEVVPNVDVSTLDHHFIPKLMGAPVWRGIWYPSNGIPAR